MATSNEKYFTEILDHLNNYTDHYGQGLTSENLWDAVIRVMEEEEEDAQNNVNNVTKDTSFQYPVAMNVQNKDANMWY